jgi:PTS system ascorbate-specific IIB component
MLKVFAVCGMGLGTSVILKSRLKEALNAQGVDYNLDITDASAANGQDADLIFTSDELAPKIRNKKAKVVIINNFTDRSEIRQKAEQAVAELGG